MTLQEEIINDIADALNQQHDEIAKVSHSEARPLYLAQLQDDTIAMAIVVVKYAPDFDIDLFYKRAGYIGTHPEHGRR